MINAHRLIYNGLSSEEFDLIVCLAFDSESGASNSFLNREAISTEVYDGSRKRIYGAKYTDSATPRFTLIKQDFQDFTPEENRRVLSWLTSNDKPSWLEVYQDDSNVLSYRYFCVPTAVEQYKLSNGRVVGYEFEIFSDAPYAYSRKFIYPEVYATIEEGSNNDETNDYLTVFGTEPITITCNTDEYNKLIYPKVVINFDKNKDIYIPVNKLPDNMIPNAIYTYGKKYYISIVIDNGASLRAEVVPMDVNADLEAMYNNEKLQTAYFYIKDDHTIRQIVKDGEIFVWKTIVKVGAAIRINTSYMFEGKPITKEVELHGAAPGEEITLDGTNKVISVVRYDDKGNKIDDVRVIGGDFNWEWLPLAYGDNNITITGNCDVQIQWIEPRKVGSL